MGMFENTYYPWGLQEAYKVQRRQPCPLPTMIPWENVFMLLVLQGEAVHELRSVSWKGLED